MADTVHARAIRSKPLQLRQTSELSRIRLGAGEGINSPRDKRVNALTAEELSACVHDLGAISQKIGTAIKAIQAAEQSIPTITELIRLARALVKQAQRTTDVAARPILAGQFDVLPTQINQLAGETNLTSTSLLGPDDPTLRLSEGVRAPLTVTFLNNAAGDLAINRSQNNWATDADIEVAAADLKLALVVLRSRAQTLRSSLATLKIRHDFTKEMIGALQTVMDNSTFTGTGDEGANLLALQGRQHLSTTALSIATRAGKNVSRLF